MNARGFDWLKRRPRLYIGLVAIVALCLALGVFGLLMRPGVAMTVTAEGSISIDEGDTPAASGRIADYTWSVYTYSDGDVLVLTQNDPLTKKDIPALGNIPDLQEYLQNLVGIKIIGTQNASIAPNFAQNVQTLKNVDLQEAADLKKIPANAFYGCEALRTITLPEAIESIQKSAFFSCGIRYFPFEKLPQLHVIEQGAFQKSGLTEATLKDATALTTIGSNAFLGCTSLKAVDMSGLTAIQTIPSGVFRGCTSLQTVDMSGMTAVSALGDDLFKDCTALTTVKLDGMSAVTLLGYRVFQNCTALTTVRFDDMSNLTKLGAGLFQGCSALESLDLSHMPSLTSIKTETFQGCSSLKTLTLNVSELTTLEWRALSGCAALASFDFSHATKLQTIGQEAFADCTSLTMVEMPETNALERVALAAFHGCNALERVHLHGQKLQQLDADAFSACKSLVAIDLEEAPSLTTIGHNAFSGCTSLATVDLSHLPRLTSIGGYAFYGCTSLGGVDLSGSPELIQLGEGIFRNCSALTRADLSGSPKLKEIPAQLFYLSRKLMEVKLPENNEITRIGKSAFDQCQFSSFPFDRLGKVEVIDEWAFFDCEKIQEVAFPEGSALKTIAAYAFGNMYSLKTFRFDRIPLVEEMGRDVFAYDRSLIEADMTALTRLQAIPRRAFYGCIQLRRVNLPRDGGAITAIGSEAFVNCSLSAGLDTASLRHLETVGDHAFAKTGLTSLDFGGTALKSVGDQAFGNARQLTGLSFRNCAALESLGQNLFISDDGVNMSVTEIDLSGCTALSGLPNDFSDGLDLLAHVDVSGCTGLREIGDRAFSGRTFLRELTGMETCTALETIGEEAFSGCTAMKSLHLGESVTCVGNRAFAGTAGLTTVVYDRMSGDATVAGDAFADAGKQGGLTVRVTADTRAVAGNLFAENAYVRDVVFEGENPSLILRENAFSAAGTPLADMCDSGNAYFVDAAGAVYSQDRTTLRYIPPHIAAYTVPDTVTQVAPGSCARATALTSLTFAAPERVTALADGAFAECPTLSAINGCTVVQDVRERVFPGAQEGVRAYYRTGLRDGDAADGAPVRQIAVTAEGDSGDNARTLTLAFGTDSGNYERLLPDGDARIPDIDEQSAVNHPNVRYYQTNEVAKLTVSASTPKAFQKSTCIRVYFDCATENMHFEYAPGSITITDSNGEKFNGRFDRVIGTRLWCLELEIGVGKTLALETALYYPNFSGVSQSVRIWGEIFESADDAPALRTAATEYLEGNWFSAHREWNVAKSMAPVTMKMVFENGQPVKRLNNIAAQITSSAAAISSLTGVDPVVEARYEDTLSLPEGITWERAIVEAIRAGRVDWRLANVKTSYIFVTLSDGTQVNVVGVDRPICDASLRYDESTGQVVVCWTCANARFRAASPSGQWMEAAKIGVTFYSERLFAVSASYELGAAGVKMTNAVTQQVRYLFAGEASRSALAQGAVLANVCPNIQITKRYLNREPNRPTPSNAYGGDRMDFTLTVSNNGLAAPQKNTVSDPLPNMFRIAPRDMDRMFAEDMRHDLSITIRSAYLQPAERRVTTIDGQSITLEPIGRGDALVNTDSRRVEIVWASAQMRTVTVYDGETVMSAYSVGPGAEYADLQTLFRAIGLVDRYETVYVCQWTSADYPTAGMTVTYPIYATVKTSFESLQRDSLADIYEGQKIKELRGWNTAVDSWKYNETAKSVKSSVGNFMWWREVQAAKTILQGGESAKDGIAAGEVLDVEVSANRMASNADYGALPMNSAMHGAAVFMAPVDGNAQAVLHRPDGETVALPQAGLEIFTDPQGRAYYLLSAEGMYTDLFIGTDVAGRPARADRVEVSREDGDTHSHAFWYVADASSYGTYTIRFKALPDVKYGAVREDGTTYLQDTFYLNEREGDRLFVPTGFGVRQLSSEKFVVLANPARYGEQVAKDSVITQGQDVTYKLSVINKHTTTAYAPAVQYDKLPNTYGRFAWTKDNVRIVSSRGETPAWRISPVSPNGEVASGIYYIYWNELEDGDPDEGGRYADHSKPTSVILSEQETLDFYVTLTFPRDDGNETAWSAYSEAVFANGNALTNTFCVNSMVNVTTHQLPVVGRPLLQKGVYGIYKRYAPSVSSAIPNKSEYAVSDGHDQFVTYYVALYNAGETRMYLNPIVDVLPKGVEFRNLCSVTGASGTLNHDINLPSVDGTLWTAADQLSRFYPATTQYDSQIFTYAYKPDAAEGHLANELLANVVPEDMATEVEYVSAHIKGVYNTWDGRNALTLSVRRDYDDTAKYPTGTIGWDEEREMSYLEPHQALVFGYLCDIGDETKTGDLSRNTVAMEYYDHNQAGCQLPDEDIRAVAGNQSAYGDGHENDGDCRLLSGEEAEALDIAKTAAADSRWLCSQVDIRPAVIVVPGVQKQTVSRTKSTGETEPLIEQGFCEPKDTQAWSVELHNDGAHDLDSYTFVDTLQYPYVLCGDITMQTRDALNGQLRSKGGFAREETGGQCVKLFATEENNVLLKNVRFKTADGQPPTESYLKTDRDKVRVTFETQIGTMTSDDAAWLATRPYSVKLGEERAVEVDRLLLKRVGDAKQQNVLQTVTIYVTFDFDENLNCVMKLRFDREDSDGFGAIPAYGGTATLTTQSAGLSDAIAYGTIVNRAALLPADGFTFDKIERGMPLRNDAGKLTGVSNEASFAVKGSFSTLSWKTVTQDGDTRNTASSRASGDETNFITLPVPTAQSHVPFTYRLNVMNTCTENRAIERLVMFDSLPQRGDRHPFTEAARGSDFGVTLTALQEAFRVYDVDEAGRAVAIRPASDEGTLGYSLEFSTDPAVEGSAAWMPAAEAVTRGLDASAIRSFRVTVTGGSGIASGHTVAVDVNARVSGDAFCRPGAFAWNNFGYSYTLRFPGASEGVALSASSRVVGVQLAEVPRLQKSVEVGTGRELTHEELAALQTEFIVYRGEAIDYADRQELLQKLAAQGTPFLRLTIDGAQLGQWREMSGKVWQARQDADTGAWAASETTADWTWTEGETYTVTESGMSARLRFDSVRDDAVSRRNTYSFLYRRDGQYRVAFADVFDDYDLLLQKVAQDTQTPLSDGVFARYLPVTGAPGDETYRQAVERLYTAHRGAYIQAVKALEALDTTRMTLRFTASGRLESAPAYADFLTLPFTYAAVNDPADIGNAFCMQYVVDNGDGSETTYCFVDYAVTGADGAIQYNGVTDDAFAFVEIASPPDYTLDHRLHRFVRAGRPGQLAHLSVIDEAASELPMTGSRSIRSLLWSGAVLLLLSTAGAVVLLGKRRRRRGDGYPAR